MGDIRNSMEEVTLGAIRRNMGIEIEILTTQCNVQGSGGGRHHNSGGGGNRGSRTNNRKFTGRG